MIVENIVSEVNCPDSKAVVIITDCVTSGQKYSSLCNSLRHERDSNIDLKEFKKVIIHGRALWSLTLWLIYFY